MRKPLERTVALALSAATLGAGRWDAPKPDDDGKCRILSFRGGGVHGSYEVGVLNALVDLLPEEELRYDYVTGVSIGAVNASIFATFEKGDEKSAAY